MNEESKRFVVAGLVVIILLALGVASTIWIRNSMITQNEDHAVRSLRKIGAAQARASAGSLKELGEAGLIDEEGVDRHGDSHRRQLRGDEFRHRR